MNVERKLGVNRGKRRLWLEGSILLAAGLKPGDKYALRVERDELCMRLLAPGASPSRHEEPRARTVSGKGAKPIMDLAGGVIVRAFGELDDPESTRVVWVRVRVSAGYRVRVVPSS